MIDLKWKSYLRYWLIFLNYQYVWSVWLSFFTPMFGYSNTWNKLNINSVNNVLKLDIQYKKKTSYNEYILLYLLEKLISRYNCKWHLHMVYSWFLLIFCYVKNERIIKRILDKTNQWLYMSLSIKSYNQSTFDSFQNYEPNSRLFPMSQKFVH